MMSLMSLLAGNVHLQPAVVLLTLSDHYGVDSGLTLKPCQSMNCSAAHMLGRSAYTHCSLRGSMAASLPYHQSVPRLLLAFYDMQSIVI